MEIKRIEVELQQKIRKLVWKRIEQQSQETPDEKGRGEEMFRVIGKIRITPIQNNTNEQGTSKIESTEETRRNHIQIVKFTYRHFASKSNWESDTSKWGK